MIKKTLKHPLMGFHHPIMMNMGFKHPKWWFWNIHLVSQTGGPKMNAIRPNFRMRSSESMRVASGELEDHSSFVAKRCQQHRDRRAFGLTPEFFPGQNVLLPLLPHSFSLQISHALNTNKKWRKLMDIAIHHYPNLPDILWITATIVYHQLENGSWKWTTTLNIMNYIASTWK